MEKARITVLGLLGKSVFMRVPHFHAAGETLSASSLYTEPGGKGSNQAVAAARLGADVTFISAMGRDPIAEECLSFMEHEGICCLTQYADGYASPYACILTDDKGENQVTVHRGSAELLSADFVRQCEQAIAQADILLLNNECPLCANLAAADIAQRHRVKIVLNPAPYTPLPPELLRRCYIITPNRHEAALLSGMSPGADSQSLIAALGAAGVSRCVITLGGDGAISAENGVISEHDAVSVRAVDTTGAGDCFNGALCTAIAEGRDLPDAVDFAVRASAVSVSGRYVMPSLPYRNDPRLSSEH